MDSAIVDTTVNGVFPNSITNIANDTIASCQARCLHNDECSFITFRDDPDETQVDSCELYEVPITAAMQATVLGTSLSVKILTNDGNFLHILGP